MSSVMQALENEVVYGVLCTVPKYMCVCILKDKGSLTRGQWSLA